jgi:hypothetical protein
MEAGIVEAGRASGLLESWRGCLSLTHIDRKGVYEQKETTVTKSKKTVLRYLGFLLFKKFSLDG